MRIVTFSLEQDAMDAAASGGPVACRTKRWRRSAKSCGPGAATLALRWRRLSRRSRGQERPLPGESTYKPPNIARGKPGCLGCTCQIRVRSCLPIAHGAAGAVGARLSLRLSSKERSNALQKPGHITPRERERMPDMPRLID